MSRRYLKNVKTGEVTSIPEEDFKLMSKERQKEYEGLKVIFLRDKTTGNRFFIAKSEYDKYGSTEKERFEVLPDPEREEADVLRTAFAEGIGEQESQGDLPLDNGGGEGDPPAG